MHGYYTYIHMLTALLVAPSAASQVLRVTAHSGSTCSSPSSWTSITSSLSGLPNVLEFPSGGGCVPFNDNAAESMYGACSGTSPTLNFHEYTSTCGNSRTNAAKGSPTSWYDGQCWAAGGGSLKLECVSGTPPPPGGDSTTIIIVVVVGLVFIVMMVVVGYIYQKKAVARRRERSGAVGSGAPPVAEMGMVWSQTQMIAQPAGQDKVTKLKELKELLDSGALTQEEFDGEKKNILAGPTIGAPPQMKDRFDPETGKENPKFDPVTGVQNW